MEERAEIIEGVKRAVLVILERNQFRAEERLSWLIRAGVERAVAEFLSEHKAEVLEAVKGRAVEIQAKDRQ